MWSLSSVITPYPDLCLTLVPIQVDIQSCLFKWNKYSLQPKILKKKRRCLRVEKKNAFWHPTVEKPLLILAGIKCLHSTTNTPFAVVTPNGANQISHTLERGEKQRPACRRKTAVSLRKQLKLADFWLPSKHVDCKNLPHTKLCCHIKGRTL